MAIRANSIVNGGVSTSFALLFYLDQITIETKNVNITGHQWYRSNETEESSVATVEQHVVTKSKEIKALTVQPDQVATYKELLKRIFDPNKHTSQTRDVNDYFCETRKHKRLI